MLIPLLRKNRPGGLVVLPLFFALLWPGVGADTWSAATIGRGMPLYQLAGAWAGESIWGAALLAGVAVLITAVLLAVLCNRVGLFAGSNYLPALLLPVIMALFPGGLAPGPALLGMPFVLLAMVQVWSASGRSSALMPLVDAGILIALAGLFHLPYLLVLVPLWASLSVMRPLYWREYVLPVLGTGATWLIAWGLVKLWPVVQWDPFASIAAMPPATWQMHWMHRVVLLVWAALAGITLIWWTWADYGRSVMLGKNVRAAFYAFSFSLAVLAAFEVVVLGNEVRSVLLAVPLAVLLSNALVEGRSGSWGAVCFWGLVLLGLWGRWMG